MKFILFVLLMFSSLTLTATPAQKSLNKNFIGTWQGLAPIGNLCKSKNMNNNGQGEISLKIKKPLLLPGANYKITLLADWGCFAKMEILGFILANEFWGASDDRMTFTKLILEPNDHLSGEFRIDLNGHTLKMNFSNLKRKSKKLLNEVSYASPIEFLGLLQKKCCNPVSLMGSMPKNWITEKDVKKLVKLVHDKSKASPVVSMFSSNSCTDKISSVGREALFLIKGFQTGKYPPSLCSTWDFKPDDVKYK
jgi:hypothetical protein